ncbi:hypothetical protein [Lichenibacterium dinghuense]|uniref:hypothetical protein n=1 Tax=Lichenibacterium dinghuense TaxID=2895977 RepID=UPI001F3EE2BE|nr:hypothetical protein [Lichenibacterium sp. 6Y81]
MSLLFGPLPPYIDGIIDRQSTIDEAPIAPFTTVTVFDPTPDAIDTLYIGIRSDGQGTLSGEGLGPNNTLTGTASQITDDLRSIIFTPINAIPGQTLNTDLTLTVISNSSIPSTVYRVPVTDTSTAPVETLSIDPDVVYEGNGTFAVSGKAYSYYGVNSVQFSANVYGSTFSLGSAVPSSDESYTFVDNLGTSQIETQSFIRAQIIDGSFSYGALVPAQFDLTGGITGKRYTAEQNIYNSDGSSVLSSTYFREDGSRAVNVLTGGQTFSSSYEDTFLNHGAPENTFVFNSGFGSDLIRQFRVNGEDHDTLSLAGGDFHNSIAEVLHNTSNVGGAAVITDPTTGDTIRLAGVSKAQLVHNQAALSFHT